MAVNSDLFTRNRDDEALPPLTDEELAGILQNEISVALGSDQDDLVGQRSEAMNYYFGRSPGRATKGNSNTVSLDVADMTEALLAQIMPSFGSDSVSSFEASGPEDEKQATAETDFCNYVIMQQCDGYLQFYQAIKDALLLKNGIIKVYVDESMKVRIRQYPELDETEQAIIEAEADMAGQQVQFTENDNGVEVKTFIPKRKLCMEAVSPEHFVITSDQRSHNVMDECDFCAERKVVTQSWLIERGHDPMVVQELPTEDVDTQVDELARNQSQEEDEHYWYEAGTRPIEVWEAYIKVDYDRDGVAELRRVLFCNRTILENEPVDWIPYATGVPFINSNRWLGISLFDKIKWVQDQKTDFVRQYINNMRYHNNRRLGVVENQVNYEDVLNSRPGQAVRCASRDAVWEIPVTDIGPSCMNMLSYLDKMRSERGGASLDMQTQGMTVGGDTAHGVERQMSFKEMLASLITKTLGETLVKQTYLLVHRTYREMLPEATQAKIGQDWQQVQPGQWPEREHVSITVGMSPHERTKQAGALLQTLSMQQQALASGLKGILTDAGNVYNTVTDYCRMNGLDNPDQYWIDPDSEAARLMAQQMAQQQQMTQAQMNQQQQQAFSSMLQVELAKIQAQMEASIREHEIKVAEMLLKSEAEQAKITQQTEQLDAQQAQIRNASGL